MSPFLMLFAVLVLAATTPVAAQQRGHHENSAATTQPAPVPNTAQTTTGVAPGEATSSMEMTWPTGDGGMMMGHHERPKSFVGRLIAWFGAWHPAIIYFPIALLLIVGFL